MSYDSYGNYDYVEDVKRQAREDHARGGNYFDAAEYRCLGNDHPLHGVYINERAKLDVQKDRHG